MSSNFTNHFSADDAALLLIDFQPQMFMGVESHDRNAIKNNLQIIAKSAKLFNVPTVLSTVTAETFAGPFVPEVTEGVFPGHEVVDRTSINAWLTPNFVKAVEATQAEGFQGVHFSQIPKGPIENSLIIDETNTTDNDFNKQEKPMSTSSTIADSSAPSANHTIIRVGLIGVGNWALNGPVRVLSLMPQYEMAAVYSQRRDAAQSAADTFGIRHVVGSIDELVRHPDVDIVLVLTTGPQHEEAVRAAIAAGKTVYCEWPLTPDSKTSAELVDLAAKAGVQTILGTQRRFAPGLRYLKDLLGDGYVGRVRSVRMHVTVSSFGKNRSKALRWSAFPENFMGVTSIFGAHLMDPLFSIVGRPTEISAVSVNQWPEITIVETGEEISTKVPDQLLLQGILASGAVFAVHIEGGKHHGTGVQIDITGDDGDLQITNTSAFGDVGEEYNLFGARVADTKMAPLAVPASYNWLPPSDLPSGVLELADLFEVHARDLASGSRTVPSFEDALFMQRLLEQAAVSSASGHRIKL